MSMELNKLKYFIIDVDGTLTDSGIYYDSNGVEIKRFSTRDYVGVMAAHYMGIETVIVTGRMSLATKRRAEEMKVDYLFQQVKNKKLFVEDFMKSKGILREQLGYVGDDLNDLAAMSYAGFKACPQDGCLEIKKIADYISPVQGGKGVLQDVFRYILNECGIWDSFLNEQIMKGY